MGKLLFSSVRWRTKEKIKHNTRNQGKKYCIDNIVDMWFAKMQVSFFKYVEAWSDMYGLHESDWLETLPHSF